MGARCVQQRGTLDFQEAIDRHNELFVVILPEGCLAPSAARSEYRHFTPFCFKTKYKMKTQLRPSIGQKVRLHAT